MAKVDDLTILLKMQDKTSGAFKSLNKRFGALSGLAGKLAKGFTAVGAAAVAGFAAAVASGQEFVSELNLMSSALGIGKREADALYQVIKQSNPAAEIDRVKEGVLTLTEAFFDARIESGPLIDAVEKFGVTADFSIEGAREQLVEFLRAMQQLPSETDRVGFAIASLGGDDAKAFLPLIRNVELLDQRIEQLSGSIDDIPNVYSEADVQALDGAKMATDQLNAAWENFGKTAFRIVAPAIEKMNTLFAGLLRNADTAIRRIAEALSIIDNRDRITVITDSITLLNESMARTKDAIASVTQDDLDSFLFGSVNAAALKSNEERLLSYTNQLIALRAELESLTSQSAAEPITLPQIGGSTTRKGTSKKEKGPLNGFGTPIFEENGFVQDLNGQVDIEKLQQQAEAYKVTSDNLKLFTADTDAARASTEAFQTVMNSAQSALGTLGDAFARTRAQARVFVGIQQTLALVSAYSAATQALADITSPTPFQKFAAYSSVLAQGLAGVAAIKRAGSSIGASGGGSTSAAAATSSATSNRSQIGQNSGDQTQNNQPQQIVNVQLSGAGILGEEILKEFVDKLNRSGYSRELRIQ